MSKGIAIVVAAVLVAVLLLFMSTYTVRFHEVAVKTRYLGGATARAVETRPGLHARMPLVTDVTKLDTRVRIVETAQIEVATADEQSVVVQAFLMWKVDTADATAPLRFAQAFETMADADRKLRGDLPTALSSTLGRYRFDDLIGPASRLPEAEQAIMGQLGHLGGLGIAAVSAGISQVLLPTRTTTAVLERMEEVRKSLAARERARGESEASGIRSEANTVADKLIAFANQRAEEIKAGANVVAARYFAEMREDEQLAVFLVWLDTLEGALKQEVTIFLSDQAAPWHLMNIARLPDARDIPQPAQRLAADGDQDREPVPAEEHASDRGGS